MRCGECLCFGDKSGVEGRETFNLYSVSVEVNRIAKGERLEEEEEEGAGTRQKRPQKTRQRFVATCVFYLIFLNI